MAQSTLGFLWAKHLPQKGSTEDMQMRAQFAYLLPKNTGRVDIALSCFPVLGKQDKGPPEDREINISNKQSIN